LFGWQRGAFTGACEPNEGFLGRAHQGTLFLDEIHHLAPPLQAALLGPLNNKTYNRMGEPQQPTYSDFDLVVATNDPQWATKLMPDFRDRIERIVFPVPSFANLQEGRRYISDIWLSWDFAFKRRCVECGIMFPPLTPDCRVELNDVFTHKPLKGNWRDLFRLADHILLYLTDARVGRPQQTTWDVDKLREAIAKSFP
jgi:transcriptional regulator with AAA-type ATPase domain